MTYQYRSNQYWNPKQNSASDRLRAEVLQKVMNGLGLATAVVFVVLFGQLPSFIFFIAMGVELITIIGYFLAKSEATIEKLYYAFVAATAVVLGYTVGYVIVGVTGGLEIVFYAFGLTTAVVGGIYYYIATKTPDVTGMGKYLFVAGLMLIGVLVVGIFVPFGSGLNLGIAIFGAVLFSLYLYYDLGRLMNDQYRSPARMAWSIYWDILLIFKFILRILLLSND